MNEDIESLWHTYSSNIYGYFFKQLRNHYETDDLVSTVYLRVVVAYSNGNGYNEHEAGWIWSVARSVLLDYWRAKRRVTMVDWDSLAERADDDDPLEVKIENSEQIAEVRRAVAELPELQAMVTTWRLCGYDYEELAEGLGKGYGAVKAIQVRAYAGLREALRDAA